MNLLKLLSLTCLLLAGLTANAAPKRQFYEIRIYHVSNTAQAEQVHRYLRDAYLPALHRAGITSVGVFTPIVTDTVYAGKRIVVLIPFQRLEQFTTLYETLEKDKQYLAAGRAFIDAPHTAPTYSRVESTLLQAFTDMPVMELPKLQGPKGDRIYELRSYESHSEKAYHNKVQMFNAGGEIKLFKRLEFNAVFYGEVLAGANMPNLMYMTSFKNKADRDAHWQTFRDDPEWKKLWAAPEYQNNVSKNTQYLLNATEYSDI